jgi:hypothetical protein
MFSSSGLFVLIMHFSLHQLRIVMPHIISILHVKLYTSTVSLSDGDLLIGPCRSQRPGQRQEARTGQGGPGTRGIIKEEPGPKECPVNTRVPNPFFQEGQVRRYRVQTPPPLPPPSGQPGQRPTTPLHRATPSPRKLSSRIDLGENLVLASKSGSEIMVRAQDDRTKHFWLNGISLRGQAAELETSAG